MGAGVGLGSSTSGATICRDVTCYKRFFEKQTLTASKTRTHAQGRVGALDAVLPVDSRRMWSRSACIRLDTARYDKQGAALHSDTGKAPRRTPSAQYALGAMITVSSDVPFAGLFISRANPPPSQR